MRDRSGGELAAAPAFDPRRLVVICGQNAASHTTILYGRRGPWQAIESIPNVRFGVKGDIPE